jgi:hypothetical protein
MPSALAVLKFMASSKTDGCSIGRSAGFFSEEARKTLDPMLERMTEAVLAPKHRHGVPFPESASLLPGLRSQVHGGIAKRIPPRCRDPGGMRLSPVPSDTLDPLIDDQ